MPSTRSALCVATACALFAGSFVLGQTPYPYYAAKLVKLEDKTVHLERKADAQIVAVPSAKLSPEDRAFARSQAGNQAKSKEQEMNR